MALLEIRSIPWSFACNTDKLKLLLMFAVLNLTGSVKMVVRFISYDSLDLAFVPF